MGGLVEAGIAERQLNFSSPELEDGTLQVGKRSLEIRRAGAYIFDQSTKWRRSDSLTVPWLRF